MQFPNRSNRQDELPHFGRDTLQELRVRRASPMPGARNAYDELKAQLLQALMADCGQRFITQNRAAAEILLQERLDALLVEGNIILKQHEKRRLTADVMAELLGFGPLEPLLKLADVDQILVNGPEDIFIRRQGQHQRVEVAFEDDAHLLRLIERLVAQARQQPDQDSPVLNTRMADGSQVHVVLPSAISDGPLLTIRRAVTPFYTIEDLCSSKMLTGEVADFLQSAVAARLNIIISGLAATGKTTLLRALCRFIPAQERIVTIEQTAELHLDHDQVIKLETRPAAGGGKSSISAESLLMATSRIRPDRLVLGSIQGSEAYAWLQVINAGLGGSMTTCSGDSAQEALSRIALMALLGGPKTPQNRIRQQIIAAVDLIVHLERGSDNQLRVVSISEVTAFAENQFVTSEIFHFNQTGHVNGEIIGTLQATGARSHCAQKMREAGISPLSSLGI